MTLFIAVIGFRLALGHVPDMRDGVGWALRLGFVLALVTSWATFQAIVYRVAVDGPQDVASRLMSSAGLSSDTHALRVQVAYDQLRVGQGMAPDESEDEGSQPETGAALIESLPKTATLLVVSTVGLTAALKLGVGFLLALSPFAILSLLFNGTAGLLSGWLRALAGLMFALIGTSLVTAAELLVVEGELSRSRLLGLVGSAPADTQSLSTIAVLFALVAAVITVAGMWFASALKLPRPAMNPMFVEVRNGNVIHKPAEVMTTLFRQPEPSASSSPAPTRAFVVARALSSSIHREQRTAAAPGQQYVDGAVRQQQNGYGSAAPADSLRALSPGLAGRRGIGRRTVSAARRDQIA
ncbi:MAG TPA: type IV secretion system protein [Sphingomicrobium sp.]|nr:type IV secretion system protein [Sphingomicrobium sp.]